MANGAEWLDALNKMRTAMGLPSQTEAEALADTAGGGGVRQPEGSVPADPYGRQAVWDEDDGQWRYPPDWGVDPSTTRAGYLSPWQQGQLNQGWAGQAQSAYEASQKYNLQLQQLAWDKQQAELQARVERERIQTEAGTRREEQLATLRAQPASWLEYALLAGQQPAIQPWMLPLMPQQYQGLQAGGAIPNWQEPLVTETEEEAYRRLGMNPQAHAEMVNTPGAFGYPGEELEFEKRFEREYTGYLPRAAPTPGAMPALTTPSAQYLARMGPTAQAQYGGYERARSGIRPEELQMRLWSAAPPSGKYQGLRWQR